MNEEAMDQNAALPDMLTGSEPANGIDTLFESFEPDAAPAQDEDVGLEAVHEVPLKVQAVLGRSRLPIGELLRLKSGAIVQLDRKVGEPVDIFVNNRLIARGEVVMIDDALGVTLTEIIRPDR